MFRRTRTGAGVCVALIVVLAGCATAPGPRGPEGQVTARATVDTYSLRVGDCTGPIPAGSADRFTLIPCGDKHNWEAFARMTLNDDAYPGAKTVSERAGAFCEDAFAAFVGVKRSKSAYELTSLQPTQATWDNFGDREILCLAGRSTGTVTGSLEGIESPAPSPSATPTK